MYEPESRVDNREASGLNVLLFYRMPRVRRDGVE